MSKASKQKRSAAVPQLKAASYNQQSALVSMEEKAVTVLEGLAGTGKTYLAVHMALQMLAKGEITKILLTRPLINVGNEKLGFLPGDVNDKTAPYAEQLYEYLDEFMPAARQSKIKHFEESIEFIPIAYLRGRNFANTVIIVDEAQNTTPLQLKTVLTRAAENTKIFILGDTKQSDYSTTSKEKNGLTDLVERLKGRQSKFFGHVKFGMEDIQRSDLVKEVMKIYGDI